MTGKRLSTLMSAVFLTALSPYILLATEDKKNTAETSVRKISWPVPDDKKFQISSTFGESRLDHFHNGLDIPGENVQVRPVDKGRVFWLTEGKEIPGELPFGGGKTVILAHKDFWSGYMHLKSFNPTMFSEPETDTKKSLGLSGSTGHSGGAHLHFFIFEPGKRKMYNPLLLLDHSYYQDTKPPEIQELAVALPERMAVVNPERPILMSADFPMGIRITDRGKSKERWGVYKISIRHKDTLVKSAVFDYLTFGNNRWQTSNGLVFEDMFLQNYYNLGKGVKQNRNISIAAADLKGQTVSREYNLEIVEK